MTIDDKDGTFGHADGNSAIMSGGAGEAGDPGYGRRTQLFIFLCISIACWVPIMALAYLFF
ncbi:MAG: hypothetical protein HOK21_21635 [Rhodospirillaceae bacterium]|jgi:hypothetical protein|nr:hypothetical protein [Rhodospirillaceae bacterium]MBT4043642.1 hypothetical protein [Rhodospirillaceae bacterium]MBT4691670.1 hypothetical protein [Rhodospirillaceae bacterium]MBT5082177.1 hypothetical protein [Rhodospirillaceae bacterium]MBT5526696.1 hypothetical protein [Rhodospirillaceae bacterium]